jgi:hypothetical protein
MTFANSNASEAWDAEDAAEEYVDEHWGQIDSPAEVEVAVVEVTSLGHPVSDAVIVRVAAVQDVTFSAEETGRTVPVGKGGLK